MVLKGSQKNKNFETKLSLTFVSMCPNSLEISQKSLLFFKSEKLSFSENTVPFVFFWKLF